MTLKNYVLRKTTPGVIAACLVVSATLVRAQAQKVPDVDEAAIAKWIDAHNSEALALLERVVNINSGTDNLAGVRQVGGWVSAECDAVGFKTAWVDGAAFGRAGHLVATHPGPGPKILLIGHLDTVFPRTVPSRSSSGSTRTPRRAPASST